MSATLDQILAEILAEILELRTRMDTLTDQFEALVGSSDKEKLKMKYVDPAKTQVIKGWLEVATKKDPTTAKYKWIVVRDLYRGFVYDLGYTSAEYPYSIFKNTLRNLSKRGIVIVESSQNRLVCNLTLIR